MNPFKYGKIIKIINNIFFVQINPKNMAIIDTAGENENKVEIHSEGKLILEYFDKLINSNTNSFERILGKNKYIYF